MMPFLKNKYLNLIIVLFLLFTLFLLLLETLVYPGIAQKYTHVSIVMFSLVSIILIFVRNHSYKPILEKMVLFITIVLALITVYLNIEEVTHFPNFVFSRYHVSPISLQLLFSFFLAQVFIIAIRKKSYIRRTFSIFLYLKTRYKILMLLLFSIIFSFSLIYNNFKAQWGIIDDHEIAYFLGSDRKIYLSELPGILSKTEVGSFGQSSRYRPSYYLLKVTESFLWKGSPQLWYFARYVILALFLFTILYLVSKYFGIIPAIVFCLYIMTGKYWPDILTRLGPAEIYVVLGLSFYSFGLVKIIGKKSKSLFPWLLFLFGGLIATGSKENMAILAIPSLYLVVHEIVHHKWNWKLVLPILHILFSLFVFTSVYLAISKTGQDVYANEVTIPKIFQLIFLGFSKTVSDLKMVWIVALGILLSIPKRFFPQRYSFNKFFINHKNAIFLSIFLCLIYFAQFIFYSGVWPTATRYDFPGILAMQVFWLCCFYIFLEFIREVVSLKSQTKIFLLSTLSMVFFGYLYFITFNTGYFNLMNASENNMLVTSLFTNNLTNLSNLAKAHPNYAIIIKSGSPRDYEPVFSLERFIRFMGVTNPIYINYKDIYLAKRNVLEKQLSEKLTQMSENGISKKIGTNCILVLLSEVKDNNECALKIGF